jgi:hypothetical protein
MYAAGSPGSIPKLAKTPGNCKPQVMANVNRKNDAARSAGDFMLKLRQQEFTKSSWRYFCIRSTVVACGGLA